MQCLLSDNSLDLSYIIFLMIQLLHLVINRAVSDGSDWSAGVDRTSERAMFAVAELVKITQESSKGFTSCCESEMHSEVL